jgi:hypothetical protein
MVGLLLVAAARSQTDAEEPDEVAKPGEDKLTLAKETAKDTSAGTQVCDFFFFPHFGLLGLTDVPPVKLFVNGWHPVLCLDTICQRLGILRYRFDHTDVVHGAEQYTIYPEEVKIDLWAYLARVGDRLHDGAGCLCVWRAEGLKVDTPETTTLRCVSDSPGIDLYRYLFSALPMAGHDLNVSGHHSRHTRHSRLYVLHLPPRQNTQISLTTFFPQWTVLSNSFFWFIKISASQSSSLWFTSLRYFPCQELPSPCSVRGSAVST